MSIGNDRVPGERIFHRNALDSGQWTCSTTMSGPDQESLPGMEIAVDRLLEEILPSYPRRTVAHQARKERKAALRGGSSPRARNRGCTSSVRPGQRFATLRSRPGRDR